MKRLNSDTGKPFKKGDRRPSSDKQDGKIFLIYYKKLSKKTGYKFERWVTEEQLIEDDRNVKERAKKKREEAEAKGIKRINPDTGKVFIGGDPRPLGDEQDGKVFLEYKTNYLGDGNYFGERWVSLEEKQRIKNVRDSRRQKNRELLKKLKKENPSVLIYELNPETGKPYIKGDTKDGMVFFGYANDLNDDGETVPSKWYTKEMAQKHFMHKAVYNIKTRMKKRGESLDPRVTEDYLDSIFPKDFICPVLGFEMKWGEEAGRMSSPSLDRFDNSKGYVYGNLIWISKRANLIKWNNSLEELKMVADFLEKNNIWN
tara:strand:- start:2111 stop:3055 length:945 start_codon:yes stop_codon:yes gene_type:complete